MGRIPISIDQQSPQDIPATQRGPGMGFNMQAIQTTAAEAQDIARAGQTIGGLLMQSGMKQKQISDEADMAKFEQLREEYDNQRRQTIGNTKNVDDINEANKTYYDNVQKLLNSDYKTKDGIPLWRSSSSLQNGINSWNRLQGDQKRQHIEHVRLLNNEANSKRFTDLNKTLIKNTDNIYDERLNRDKIRANVNTMYEDGLINKEERDQRIQNDIDALRRQSNLNQLAKMDNNIQSSVAFEENLSYYKEELDARTDLSEVEKKEYLDIGNKMLHQKETLEKADYNEFKTKLYDNWKLQANNIIGGMNDDGSLDITNKELRQKALDGEISGQFASNIISARARTDALNKKNMLKAKSTNDQIKMIASFEDTWHEVNIYNPMNDPDKSKLGELYAKIIPYPSSYSTTLVGALKSRISEYEEGLNNDQKGRIASNATILKATEKQLESMLGIGFTTKDRKLRPMKPLDDLDIDVPDGVNEDMYRYQKRLEVFNTIIGDFRNKSKTMDSNEYQEYINNHHWFKKLKSDEAEDNFFKEYIRTAEEAKMLDKYTKMDVEKPAVKLEDIKTEFIRVRDKNTGQIIVIRKEDYK